MVQIEPNELKQSVIDIIGKDWMLVSAASASGVNSMTASWGTIGFFFNKPVAVIGIRPERYTYEFVESATHFTLTILREGLRDALMVMGRNSGRDCDKVAMSGLTPATTPDGNPTFEEAKIVLVCRKIYAQTMGEEGFIDKSLVDQWYDEAHGGYHKLYMGAIESCWIAE